MGPVRPVAWRAVAKPAKTPIITQGTALAADILIIRPCQMVPARAVMTLALARRGWRNVTPHFDCRGAREPVLDFLDLLQIAAIRIGPGLNNRLTLDRGAGRDLALGRDVDNVGRTLAVQGKEDHDPKHSDNDERGEHSFNHFEHGGLSPYRLIDLRAMPVCAA